MRPTPPPPAVHPAQPVLHRAGLVLLLVVGLLLAASLPAWADTPIAVGAFVDDVPIQPGQTVTRTIRISNLSATDPVTVSIEPRQVIPLDNGATLLGDFEDPFWQTLVALDTPQVTLPPRSTREIQARIAIPADAPANDYLIGFAVSPLLPQVSPDDGFTIVNQIAVVTPVNVAGVRNRSIAIDAPQCPVTVLTGPLQVPVPGVPDANQPLTEAACLALPTVVFGETVRGVVTVRNTGNVFTSAGSQYEVFSTLSGEFVGSGQDRRQLRIAPDLVREFPVTWDAGVRIGRFEIQGAIIQPRDETAGTEQVPFVGSVIVIHPIYLAAGVLALVLLLAAVVLLVAWRVTVRRRRRRAMTAAAAPAPHTADA